MEIINMPIAEYLKKCKTVAYQRGFVWIMVLLARERDAMCSYDDLKRYWDSYDDLTGEEILFIMSISNRKEDSYCFYPAHETEKWRRIYNPHLMIMNRNVPTIPRGEFPSDENIRKYRDIAVDNNTKLISELSREFNISEKYVPSIVLFCTDPSAENKPVIIPIQSDNLYVSIKDFITEIQPALENYKKYKSKSYIIASDLKRLKIDIQQNLLSSPERRFIKAKTKLLQIMETNSANIDIHLLQKAIKEKDINACKHFSQPIRGYLNQMIDLQKKYEGIENYIEKKHSSEQQLYKKQIKLEKEQDITYDMLKEAYYNLDCSIKKYTDKGEKNMKNSIPHFKIGITFSGKYRKEYVEPFCGELLELGYKKDDIFYDVWHDVLINGIHGDNILRQIYFNSCDCVVVLLSPDYKEKNWTGHIEWSAVKELINTGNGDKICLLRVNSANIGSIDGLYNNQTIAKDIDGMSASEIAEFIDKKYNIINK